MNTEELKRLAEAATPGQWSAAISSNMNNAVHVSMGTICDTGKNIDDAAFIAAANPAAILELIRQRDELLAALEQERKRLDWALKKQAYCGRSPDRLWVDVGTGNHKWFAVRDGNPRATIDKLMVK